MHSKKKSVDFTIMYVTCMMFTVSGVDFHRPKLIIRMFQALVL